MYTWEATANLCYSYAVTKHARVNIDRPICCRAVASGSSDPVVKEFHEALQRSPDIAVAVAAIKVGHS